MRYLKDENLKKCFSLLREFIEEAPQNNQREIAVLALNQLQKITAGTIPPGSSTSTASSNCISKPRADTP
jgi:hypothetical protein